MKSMESLRGAGLLLLAAVAWGGLFPVAMVTLPVLDPFHMTALRYSITALIFVGLLIFTEGPRALRLDGHALRAALLGTSGFAGLGLLVFLGLEHSRPEHGSGSTGVGDLLLFFGAVSWVVYTLGAADFPSWSPLRYTALTCLLSLPAIFAITALATATGYAATPVAGDVETVAWQLAYIVGIGSVLGVLSWNAGNKLLGATNGVLFINFVPVTVFAIRIAQGHRFQPIEFIGAALVIGALVANNLLARRPADARTREMRKVAGAASALRPGAIKPEGCG